MNAPDANAIAMAATERDRPRLQTCLNYIEACASLGHNGCAFITLDHAEMLKLQALGYKVTPSCAGAIVKW